MWHTHTHTHVTEPNGNMCSWSLCAREMWMSKHTADISRSEKYDEERRGFFSLIVSFWCLARLSMNEWTIRESVWTLSQFADAVACRRQTRQARQFLNWLTWQFGFGRVKPIRIRSSTPKSICVYVYRRECLCHLVFFYCSDHSISHQHTQSMLTPQTKSSSSASKTTKLDATYYLLKLWWCS